MQHHLEHPTQEALERFLLHQSQEPELEIVETHILACDSCVTQLEIMEAEIAVTKTALAELQRKSAWKKSSREKRSWRTWLPVPALSFAGALAVVALSVAAFLPAQVNLTTYRDASTSLVPEWRPLDLHLNAKDLANGPLAVQLVNEQGAELWKGATGVRHEQAEVHLPRLTKPGNYFLRLYQPANGGSQSDLLREFTFHVR